MKGKHPENMNEWLHLAGSYIWGQRLATYNSKVSGKLEVWMVNGKLVLNSAHANQSYDSLHYVFKQVFDEIQLEQQPVHHVLLLGLGAGSVPAIIEEELVMNCKITAVEKDPLMIELGKKHFDINRFKQLHIVLDDALHYVQNCKQQFELIIIDLFVDDHVPEPFTNESFLTDLNRLLSNEGFLLFNMIVYTPEQLEQFKRVYHFFNEQDGVTKILQPIATNKVLYWQKC
ncbi:MAG: fused MFS/spermidine synthase [Bacteroidota bacterium]